MAFANGLIATTEYSASTGGCTSGPTQGSPFTPVPDTGDAIRIPGACNPNHDWTTTVSGSAIAAAWPQIGSFTSITDVVTDGGFDPGDHFGRVDRLTVVGTTGTVNVTGPGFADTLGLRSDFFEVTSSSAAGASVVGHGWGHGIGMGSGGPSATPSGRTTARATGPISRSSPTTTGRRRSRACPAPRCRG